MAKKSTTHKTAAKQSIKKTAETKPVNKKKNTVVVKKAAVKSAAKKIVKKADSTKKAANAKKIIKLKTTEKKTGKKTKMPRLKTVHEKVHAENHAVSNATEEHPKPITKIKGYGQKDLEHFRQIILAKRDEIIEQLQNLKEQMLDPTTGEYINENSPYSLHMAEQGTDAMEREKTFLYAQRENKFLGYLEDALKRIDAGTYGICIECIDEPQHLCDTCPLIPKARLEAVPHSQLCLPIKQRQEKR